MRVSSSMSRPSACTVATTSTSPVRSVPKSRTRRSSHDSSVSGAGWRNPSIGTPNRVSSSRCSTTDGHVVAGDDEADEPRARGAGQPPVAILLQLGEALRAVRGRVRQVKGARLGVRIVGERGGTRHRGIRRLAHESILTRDSALPDTAQVSASRSASRLVVEPQLQAQLVGVELGERVAQRRAC